MTRPTGDRSQRFLKVPMWLAEEMCQFADEWLRLILFFYLHGDRAGGLGTPVGLGELAEGAGLSLGRARLGLAQLTAFKVVEPVGPDEWRATARLPAGLPPA